MAKQRAIEGSDATSIRLISAFYKVYRPPVVTFFNCGGQLQFGLCEIYLGFYVPYVVQIG